MGHPDAERGQGNNYTHTHIQTYTDMHIATDVTHTHLAEWLPALYGNIWCLSASPRLPPTMPPTPPSLPLRTSLSIGVRPNHRDTSAAAAPKWRWKAQSERLVRRNGCWLRFLQKVLCDFFSTCILACVLFYLMESDLIGRFWWEAHRPIFFQRDVCSVL